MGTHGQRVVQLTIAQHGNRIGFLFDDSSLRQALWRYFCLKLGQPAKIDGHIAYPGAIAKAALVRQTMHQGELPALKPGFDPTPSTRILSIHAATRCFAFSGCNAARFAHTPFLGARSGLQVM
jgi:hypothetical protein